MSMIVRFAAKPQGGNAVEKPTGAPLAGMAARIRIKQPASVPAPVQVPEGQTVRLAVPATPAEAEMKKAAEDKMERNRRDLMDLKTRRLVEGMNRIKKNVSHVKSLRGNR